MPETQLGGFTIKKELNVTTAMAFISLIVMFTTGVTAWNKTQFSLQEVDDWQVRHEALHVSLNGRLDTIDRTFNSRIEGIMTLIDGYKFPELVYRVGQIEKAQENHSDRVSRIVESYSNQNAELKNQVAAMATQIAIANSKLDRLEAAQASRVLGTPKELVQ